MSTDVSSLTGTTQGSGHSSPFSREAALLLSCFRSNNDPFERANVGILVQEPVEWNELLRLARRHRLVPLLYRQLSSLTDTKLPTGLMRALREEFALNAAHGQWLLRQLREILTLLHDHGISAVPYKGPVLAKRLYGDVVYRQMTDLDILVDPEDMEEALRLLRSLGYDSPYDPTARQKRALLRADNSFKLEGGASRPGLELHWAFAVRHPISNLGPRELDLEIRSDPFLELPIPSFAPEDLLLVLCFHGARHVWERLAWLGDIAELIRLEPIDWDLAFARAERFGCERALRLGLHLAQALLGAPIPGEVIQRVRSDPVTDALARQVTERIFSDDERPADSLGPHFHAFQLRTIDRVRDRLRYLHRAALTPAPEDWTSIPLPDALFPLYYLIRPIRLVVSYAARQAGAAG